MKKMIFLFLLSIGLCFTPIQVKAEEVVTTTAPVTTEAPEDTEVVTTETPEVTEPEVTEPEVTEEATIEDIENQINDLIAKLEDAGYLDETDFGKWFEKNTGVAISVAIAFILGLLSTALLVIKSIKEAKAVFTNSDNLSNKVNKALDDNKVLIDEYQDQIKKLTEENAKLTEEFKAYVEKTNKFVDEVQAKIEKNKDSLLKLADGIDEVISNDKQREI